MKKSILFLISAIFTLLALNIATAYPVTIELNGNMQFNTAVYHCTDSTCSSLGSLYDSGSGNSISYSINNECFGIQYFAEYDYVSDRCYASHSYRNWFDESTGNGPWSYDIALEKEADCESNIDEVSYDSSLYDNESQDVTVTLRSPFKLNPDGPQIVPTELYYFYSTNANVEVKVRDSTGVIATQTQSSDILWGATKQFVFSFSGLNAGDYTLEIVSDVDDCICSSSQQQTQEKSFVVLAQPQPPEPPQNQTNQTNQTNQLPTADFTYSPIKPNVSQEVYFDASASYDPDGTIASYLWDFGDSTTATGITTTHSYSAVGNYSVTLTVADNLGDISSITKIIEVISPIQPPQPTQNQTNQTNQTQPEEHAKKAKTYGDVDNIALRDFIFKDNYCGDVSELTFEVYNQQTGTMRDVKIMIEIPELNIKEESQYFNLGKFESNWLTFNIKLPNVQGSYYARLKVTSHDNTNEMIKKLDIICLSAQPVITESVQLAEDSASQQQSGGITGNVIASARGNVSAVGIFLVFLILAIIAVVIKIITLKFK